MSDSHGDATVDVAPHAQDAAPGTVLPFDVSLQALGHYFTATSYKRLLQSVTLTNRTWQPTTDNLTLSARVETPSGLALVHHATIEIPAFGPGDSEVLQTLNPKPNFAALAQLEEAEVGHLMVTVHAGGELVGLARSTVDFLAYNQWMMSHNFHESFAAFVLPTHRVVTDIMRDVRERLQQSTGSSSTEGYYAGPGRVLELLEAIVVTLQGRGLSYTSPPASFEGYGQKIRTPDVIVAERAATCLDSSVLVASCIAAAGLNPLLAVVSGHAFVACWMTDPDGLERGGMNIPPVMTNPNVAQDLFSQGFIVPIETTLICGTPPSPFADVMTASSEYFTTRIAEFMALVDVERSIGMGVRRIPTRIMQGDTVVIEVEASPQPIVALPPPMPTGDQGGDPEVQRLVSAETPRRVRRWLDGLLDISRSNSLINMKASVVKPGARAGGGIRLPSVPGLLATLEDAVLKGDKVQLTVTTKLSGSILDDPTPEKIIAELRNQRRLPITDAAELAGAIEANAAAFHQQHGVGLNNARWEITQMIDEALTATTERQFRALRKAAEDVEQQSASNQLYLCIGNLVWREPAQPGRRGDGAPMQSPLYIVPVRISGSAKTGISLTLDEGGEITPNYCLLEKLRSELDIVIPELERPVLDDSGIDVDKAISAIRRYLGEQNHADLIVEEVATLAVLDFASFRTWKDLRDNWASFMGNGVVRHLVERAHESYIDTPQPIEGELLCPIACDESQLQAVQWAAEGRSFVLEGPPGTGKSQTIANLIASCMALGKRVLFVAEKQVALEVVSRRLHAIGLSPFCIVIHHESVTPDGIRTQLKGSLDFEGIDRSEQWSSESATIRAITHRLTAYRDGMTAVNAVGHSLWRANQETSRLGPPTRFTIPIGSLAQLAGHQQQIEDALLTLQSVVGATAVDPRHHWGLSRRADFSDFNAAALSDTLSRLAGALASTTHIRPIVRPVIAGGTTSTDLAEMDRALRTLAEGPDVAVSTLRAVAQPGWLGRVTDLAQRARQMHTVQADVISLFSPAAYGLDLTPQTTAATEAMGAGLFNKKKKHAAMQALLGGITTRVEDDPAKVVAMLQRVPQVAREVAAIDAEVRLIPGLVLPATWTSLDSACIEQLEPLAAALAERASIVLVPAASPVVALVEAGAAIDVAALGDIMAVAESVAEIFATLAADEESIARWQGDIDLLDRLEATLPGWRGEGPHFLELVRWGRIIQLVEPLRAGGLEHLAVQIMEGHQRLDGLHEEFLRARASASLAERMELGGMDRFERNSHDDAVADMVRSDGRHKQLMRTVIPRQLVERRPFKPRIRLGGVGKLEAELSRKVRRLSLPKLIREHGETVTHLTPCFLMSPDAVARLLPADSQLFDVVVFDEASQIKVASAIPAMGRAKSAVIVGDSQQMPPSQRIGSKSAAAEDDVETDDGEVMYADLESILSECRESNIPSLMLKCHFRSRHEGLIAFSNRNFYESELVTFPAPDAESATPITWHPIDGTFLRAVKGGEANKEDLRTNEEEAVAIVGEIRRRLHDPRLGQRSMGVVTLNEPQRSKILAKLTELGDPLVDQALQHPDPERRLFVNALEQVQGDERDVILMSVAFSYQTSPGGKRTIPLQFGPLINKGGERRLNVAVTRAKEEMVVFCSFDPDDMDLRTSTSTGLQMMKEFLRMARDSSRGRQGALRSRESLERDEYRAVLMTALRSAGLHVREDVGLSKFRIDVAVSADSDAGQFLAVLLDGPSWADRSTVYDREVLPDSVLHGIGWRRVGRVWLPGFIQEPSHVVATVAAEVQRELARQDLVTALTSRGLEVRDDARLSTLGLDAAVRHAGHTSWAVGIRLNGPNLFRQYLPFPGELPDVDLLRQADVEQALRIWLPDWEQDRERCLEAIDEAVSRVEALEPPGAVVFDPPAAAAIVSERLAATAPLSSALMTPFIDASGGVVVGDEARLTTDFEFVGQVVADIVSVESPIEERRLATILARRFGFAQLREPRFVSLKSRFEGLHQTDHGFGRFVWASAEQANSWKGYRSNTAEVSRSVDEIAPEEITNAMVDIVTMAGSAYEEELLRMTATVFGRKSITKPLRDRLGGVLTWAIKTGRLAAEERDGNRLVTPPPEA
jgi:hypothetical protein